MNASLKPSGLPPLAWSDALSRARADVAAGRTHEVSDVLEDIETDIAAMSVQSDNEPAQGLGTNR